jgi:phage gp36-like protein
MGNYANWDDVTARYPKAATKVDADEMQESYIAGAEAIMNGYLAKQFTTPVTGEPPLLEDICVDLTYCKIAFNQDKGVPKLKEAAMQLLKDICAGAILLTDADGAEVTSVGQAAWSSDEDYHRTHSDLGPDQDFVDPDRLNDLVSERT